MAIFNNMYITNAGQELYAKAQAGQPINFTKMQVGAGQIGTQNPATLNALIAPKLDVPIQSITANTDLKTATISGSVNNNTITDAVYICEIGLFANDPVKGEILYGYSSAGTYGDYYAPASAGPYTWNYEINAAIGNAANVTAQLSALNYDYGVINTNQLFNVISGGNQKEINKSIDASLSENTKQLGDLTYQVATGTATAITLIINKTLANGYPITFIASANNNGNATTINGKKLYKPSTTISPTLIKDKAYTVWYNSTGDSGNGCFFIKASAEGNALAKDVRNTTTFSNDNDTGILGGLDLSLLIPTNIKNNVTIDGVTGNVTIASLGGKQYATGTYNHVSGTIDTITFPFTPRIIYAVGSTVTQICSPYNTSSFTNIVGQTGNFSKATNGFKIDSAVTTQTVTYYAWE
jgi:hypothetical protein